MDRYIQCGICGDAMVGILSIEARKDCRGCGGKALRVRNHEPSTARDLLIKHPIRAIALERKI